jgi:hypothetical protein
MQGSSGERRILMIHRFLTAALLAFVASVLLPASVDAAPLRAGTYKGVFKVKKVFVLPEAGFPKTPTSQTRNIALVARCDGNGKMTIIFKERPSADNAVWDLDEVGCDVLDAEIRLHLTPQGFLQMPVRTTTTSLRSSEPRDLGIIFPFQATFGVQRTYEISLTRVGN